MSQPSLPNRRSFLLRTTTLAAGSYALQQLPRAAYASLNPVKEQHPYLTIQDGLPPGPVESPLQWKSIGDAFDSYIMDPQHKVSLVRPDGKLGFVSALEGKTDGGLTTFGPILLGKILRGDDVDQLIPSLEGYFSRKYGLFQDGVGGTLCEYWYLMNIHALAGGIIRRKLAQDPNWTSMLRRSFDRFIELAHQINYDFNDQGYDFEAHKPFTNKDIYRQPDAIGGYSYLMLFGYDFFGDQKFMDEAKIATAHYQAFVKNPWYEVPSGAMCSLAAARLSTTESQVDLHKIISFVLDSKIGLMHTGAWGGKEVDGLMSGFSTEPPDQLYSMESMMVLPYLLPVLRYRPDYAPDIGRYALNALANLRYFYSEYLPPDHQSRPELPAAFPYERLDKELHGKSPYAAGDYDSHRSVYGGAYAMWLGKMVLPTNETMIPQIDISSTDFLEGRSYPTYLIYNPYGSDHGVTLSVGGDKADIYDLSAHRLSSRSVVGSLEVNLKAGEAKVLVVIPAGTKQTRKKGITSFGNIPVDYRAG